MANISAADVKKLRELTGAGMMDCKKALTEADGDFDKAVEILRIKGGKKMAERAAEREASAGLVATSGGALVELNCETDFVAKGDQFVTADGDGFLHVWDWRGGELVASFPVEGDDQFDALGRAE